MGTLLASSILARANEIAQDEAAVTWREDQGLEWLNDAQRAVAIVRPDSSVLSGPMLLVAGTEQKISGHRLMAVTHNLGDDGSTPGRAIRLVERGVKDDHDPNWHTETPGTVIKEYIYDERVPDTFHTSPPVAAGQSVYIHVDQSVTPADVAAVGNPITLADNYGPALIEWVIYRFFSRDAEEVPDLQRAAAHFQAFFNILGQKIQFDLAISPKVRQQLN